VWLANAVGNASPANATRQRRAPLPSGPGAVPTPCTSRSSPRFALPTNGQRIRRRLGDHALCRRRDCTPHWSSENGTDPRPTIGIRPLYAASVTDWLSFWNRETRAENEPRLAGREVGEIYIPHGAGRVAIGDRIYCVGVQDGRLLLITRIDAVSVTPDEDPNHVDSVLVRGAENGIVAAYDRIVPPPVLHSLRYLRVRSTEPEPIKLTPTGDVVASAFRGRSSIREMVRGASSLDTLLGLVSLSVYGPLGLEFPNIALLGEIPDLWRVSLHLGTAVPEPLGALLSMSGPSALTTRLAQGRKRDKTRILRTDKTVILLADTEDSLSTDVQEAALSVAGGIAAHDRSLGVLIETAPSVQPETFRVVSALGREAAATELSLYVRKLK
jgi:hypothetical protein